MSAVQPRMVVTGTRADRPDGVVTLLAVDPTGTSVELELRWRLAVDLACGLLASAIRASERAGVRDDEWTALVADSFRRAAAGGAQ